MALITCPSCGQQISSFAVACPNCGYKPGKTTERQHTVTYEKHSTMELTFASAVIDTACFALSLLPYYQ